MPGTPSGNAVETKSHCKTVKVEQWFFCFVKRPVASEGIDDKTGGWVKNTSGTGAQLKDTGVFFSTLLEKSRFLF